MDVYNSSEKDTKSPRGGPVRDSDIKGESTNTRSYYN